jgi:hypothetical protein
MTSATPTLRRCPCCGHALEPTHSSAGDACARCDGSATSLADERTPLRRGRRGWLADFASGLALVGRAGAQVLHHRAFVGRLAVPIAANLVASATFAAALALLAWPRFDAWFARSWPVLDAFRSAHRDDAPVAMLLATAWWLWPVWFDVTAGAACEPLLSAAEHAIAGPRCSAAAVPSLRAASARLRRRARLLALQLLLLPAVWLLALLPVAGLPLALLCGACAAALVFADLPAVRRALPHAVLHQDLLRNWPLALGYGAGLELALMLPVFDVLLLAPAAVVGAVVLHWRLDLVEETAPPQ